MKNFEFCLYTYKHRKAIEYLVHKLIKDKDIKLEMLHRIKNHDLDKMALYQLLDKNEASRIHRETAPHHMENAFPKTKIDYIEAVLDYESAGYTKPDKPLNAYDTINKFEEKNLLDKETITELKTVLKELGIDSSYSVTEDKEGMEYLSKFENATEEEVKQELIEYLTR